MTRHRAATAGTPRAKPAWREGSAIGLGAARDLSRNANGVAVGTVRQWRRRMKRWILPLGVLGRDSVPERHRAFTPDHLLSDRGDDQRPIPSTRIDSEIGARLAPSLRHQVLRPLRRQL